MLLDKTSLARDALHAGSDAGLSLQERRILILTDGKRTLNEVMALLGPDILPTIHQLLHAGYIRRTDLDPEKSVGTANAGVAGALGGLLRATGEIMQARAERLRSELARPAQAPAPTSPPGLATAPQTSSLPAPPATSAVPRSGHRRTLVAAKMYMIDVLQLQRHPDAVEHKARIQFASGNAALLEEILAGLHVAQRLTSPSYGQRIATRLGEVLPEELLPALEQALATLHPGPAECGGSTRQLKLVCA